MYRDLKRIYWWSGMKKDIAEFVVKCQNCQQVIYEHQRPAVDRLTKSTHFIPVRIDYNVEQLPKVYVKDIVRLHGLPLSIISDRGTQFTSMFWKKLGAQDKVRSIQTKLLVAQSRQKKYVNHKVRDMAFQSSENVFLKVSPMKGVMRFGKKGKLSPRYIGPFEILESVGPMVYRLALPPNLSSVHPIFHVSMFKRYHGDGDYIIK
ncbi:hypothetical protein MTR67_018520 [Solanum verrucosum]|uniref:Integrase zinc-binding domain-containing protein n=1 Tax=Solanum verrucosum TaxID=315347 RepID=A0AAF0TT41_SOLVR|nr:hypothetical protein MTR67_018520 [Solanum verrucosum]